MKNTFDAVLTDALKKAFYGKELSSFVPLRTLVLGRGDTECLQLIFSAPRAGRLRIALPEGAQAFVQNFAKTHTGALLPDALFPVSEEGEFEADAGFGALWITYSTQACAQAGEKDVVFSLFCGDACVFFAEVSVCVYDVVLPRAFKSETHVSVGKWDIARKLGLSWEAYTAGDEKTVARVDEAYVRFYEFLVSYGLSPGALPYPPGDARAEQYLDDERVTSFVLPWNAPEETLKAWREHLLARPARLKKAMFYPVDEPMTTGQLHLLKERAENLRRAFPEALVVTPLHRDVQVDEERDSFAFLEGVTDLWCPKAALFSDYIYSPLQREKYPPIAARMRARKAAGDRLWWYVCCEPAHPYANVHMDLDLVEARELFWQQAREEVDGFLYWSVTYWQNTEDEFSHAPHYLMGEEKIPVYGDGVLCYMDKEGNPLPSVRLMAVRDGLRDFTCLWMLREKDPALYQALFAEFDTRVDSLVRDAEKFSRVRETLYQALARK